MHFVPVHSPVPFSDSLVAYGAVGLAPVLLAILVWLWETRGAVLAIVLTTAITAALYVPLLIAVLPLGSARTELSLREAGYPAARIGISSDTFSYGVDGLTCEARYEATEGGVFVHFFRIKGDCLDILRN